MTVIRCFAWVPVLVATILLSKGPLLGQSNCNVQEDADSETSKKLAAPTNVVVVTGTFNPVPLTDVDRSVTVMDVRDTTDIYPHWIDHLATDPSIDLQQRAPNDVQTDISIRGSSLGQTAVLINGLRVDDVQTSHHDMDLPLPPDALDRIEVLRGAGSTLYGSDAMGGAVNFITGPPTQSELRIGAGIGNFGINQQSASVSLISGSFGEQLSAARDFSTGFAADRDYRSLTIFSSTDARTRLGNTTLMLGLGDKPFGANQFYGPFDSWERTKTWFAGLKQALGPQTEFDLGYRRHTDVFILLRDQPAVYENNHLDESWQLALRRQHPVGQSLTLLYGAEGEYDSIESNNLGTHARSHGAAYVGANFRTQSRFSISFGGREEVFDSNGPQFAPTAAASLWLKGGWKLKGSVGRAFRLPTYTDLYYHDPANVGNPALKPESASSYEGGFEWSRGGKLRFAATGFQSRQRDVIDYVQYFPGDLFHAANLQRLNFTGVETSVELTVASTQHLIVAYTGLHGAQEALNGLISRYAFNYPINNADITWQGQMPWKLLMRTRVGVTERFARDPYALWDLVLARQFGRMGTHLALSNLANSQYQQVPGVNMPGRSVVFGMDYTMKKGARR